MPSKYSVGTRLVWKSNGIYGTVVPNYWPLTDGVYVEWETGFASCYEECFLDKHCRVEVCVAPVISIPSEGQG